MEEKAPEGKQNEESLLHKVFIDLSRQNDLKEDELEWFKSRISIQSDKNKGKEQKSHKDITRVKIITGKDEEKPENCNKLYLRLSETDTIWFFTLETYFSQDSLEDAEKVRKENETYKMKKTKKELIRKRCMADAQTPRFIEKSVGTLTAEICMEDAGVFASEWDLHDTYNALEKSSTKQNIKTSDSHKKSTSPIKNKEIPYPTAEDQVSKIFESPNFKYASLVTERLLASNCFQSEQSVFKKSFKLEYDEEPTLFSYNMEPLWSFQKDLKNPLMVTDMDWNSLNKDLLAIGYGDLRFRKNSPGLICVWSPKNPRQPERQFPFNDSVTALNFSKARPNVLAVGTSIGSIYVLDISSQQGSIRVIGRDSSNPRPGPIWKVEWFLFKELTIEKEELLAIGESGVLMRFSEQNNTDVLKLEYVTSTKKKFDKKLLKKLRQGSYVQEIIFDKKTFSGLSFSISENRNFCYISTKEGAVVKCNLRNPSMMEGVFLAHDGPVYTIQHSPVTDLVYLTCGADWNIRIWMEDMSEPVITLQNRTPVVCARWSPKIPTMIASIGQTEICLWDISRNILSPMSRKNFEGCQKPFSNFEFSSNGKNLVIGGQDGLARVIHLSQLPRIPFLKKEALISTIRKTILKNEDGLVDKFHKALEANVDKLKTKIIV